MSPWSSSVLALLWVSQTLIDRVQAQSSNCILSDPITLTDGLFLQHVQDTDSGTFTMKMTYTGGHTWLGIGINREGVGKMVPADAVIGRILADDTNDIGFYHLGSDNEDASGVQPYPSNTFDSANSWFLQTTEDGMDISVMQFTQSLDEMQVTPESVWIFAVGLPDNLWGGEHRIYGSFQLALTECVLATSSPTQATTEPTTAPVAQTTSAPVAQTTTAPQTTTTSGQNGPESGSIPDSLASASDGSEAGLVDTSSDDRGLWMAHGVILTIGMSLFVML